MRVVTMAFVGFAWVCAVSAMQAQSVTVRGELITVMCFVGNGEKGRGADHAACALKCANEGYPLAIVTETGEMYKVVGKLTADKNAALRDLLAKDVVAEGVLGEEGSGKTLDATSVKPVDAPQ
jgi:hypothetical protein